MICMWNVMRVVNTEFHFPLNNFKMILLRYLVLVLDNDEMRPLCVGQCISMFRESSKQFTFSQLFSVPPQNIGSWERYSQPDAIKYRISHGTSSVMGVGWWLSIWYAKNHWLRRGMVGGTGTIWTFKNLVWCYCTPNARYHHNHFHLSYDDDFNMAIKPKWRFDNGPSHRMF